MTVTSDCANAFQVQRDDRGAWEQAVPPGEPGSCGCPRGLAGPVCQSCADSNPWWEMQQLWVGAVTELLQ